MRAAPVKLVSSTRLYSSAPVFSHEPSTSTAAPHTSASTRGLISNALRTKRAQLSSSVTSSRSRTQCSASSSAAGASAKDRAPATTRQPRPANALAVASPSPLEAPVIQTVLMAVPSLLNLFRAPQMLAA